MPTYQFEARHATGQEICDVIDAASEDEAQQTIGQIDDSDAPIGGGRDRQHRVLNRLYVNMIKAGEAGGALEVILRRLSEFLERAQTLKKKVQGATIYPIVVVLVAVAILTFIMLNIVPVFAKMFEEFD